MSATKKFPAETFEVHTHSFISGPRSGSGRGKDGEWHVGGEEIKHSHPGGSQPHTHPDTGPSYWGHGKPRVTKRPNGEQFELIPISEEDNTFTLVVTDSALIHGETPIGDTPLEVLGFPAAERMMSGHRMKCIVRDERKKVQGVR